MTAKSADGDQFVQENKETLVRILKHGDDEFVRAMALQALIRYGNEPTLHDVQSEIERAKEEV